MLQAPDLKMPKHNEQTQSNWFLNYLQSNKAEEYPCHDTLALHVVTVLYCIDPVHQTMESMKAVPIDDWSMQLVWDMQLILQELFHTHVL